MKKRNSNSFMHPVIRFIGIPLLLLGLWFLLSTWFIITFDTSFLVLSQGHPTSSFTTLTHDQLVKGKKVSGAFVATEDNLGIISLRFKKTERVPYRLEDALAFRMREKGTRAWYYTNTYRSGFIYDMPLLPFGFPVIANSKGKVYEFELESLKGTRINATQIDTREPVLFSKYQMDKATLLADKNALMHFGIRKFTTSLQSIDVLFPTFIFALPLLFYLLWITPLKERVIEPLLLYLKKRTEQTGKKVFGRYYDTVIDGIRFVLIYSFITFLLMIIFFDIFFLHLESDLVYLFLIIMLFILLRLYHITSRFSFLLALSLMGITLISLYLDPQGIGEKSAVWAFLFLLIGIMQSMSDVKQQKQESNR